MYRGIAFFDLDGVLANCNHRLKYADKDFDKFYSAKNIYKDAPIKSGFELYKILVATGYKIVFVTSRREQSRYATKRWLADNGISIEDKDLYMRKPGDVRKSYTVKLDLVEEAIQDNIDVYMTSTCNYFVDDYMENCYAVANRYASIQTLTFGIGRINDKGGEL